MTNESLWVKLPIFFKSDILHKINEISPGDGVRTATTWEVASAMSDLILSWKSVDTSTNPVLGDIRKDLRGLHQRVGRLESYMHSLMNLGEELEYRNE